MLFLQQMLGDSITAILVLLYWFLPAFVSLFAFMSFGIKCVKKLKYSWKYYLWMFSYFGTLGSIFIYQFAKYGIPNYVIQAAKDQNVYLNAQTKTFLANVVLCDVLTSSVMTLTY